MRKLVLAAVLLGVVLGGCDIKRDAIGEPDRMIVIADSTDWTETETVIRQVFAPQIPTPQPELWYDISRISPGRFSEFQSYKNLIILSLLREGSPSLQFIRNIFSRDLVEEMTEGNLTVAKKENPWRDEQLLLILTAPSREKLLSVLEDREAELRGYFDDKFVERQKEYLYSRYEQKKLERRLSEEYGWTMRIPRDWIIMHERPEEKFIWLGRHLPIRWLSVYWEESTEPVVLDSALAVDLRKMVGEEQYDSIRINPDYLHAERTTLDGRPAIRIRGIWEHEVKARGGPFLGYTYYDPDINRLYYLDAQVFAPGMSKLVFLRQLDIVLSTFQSGS